LPVRYHGLDRTLTYTHVPQGKQAGERHHHSDIVRYITVLLQLPLEVSVGVLDLQREKSLTVTSAYVVDHTTASFR